MISQFDSIVIIGYLLITFTISYVVGKKNKDQEDFFTAKRSMPFIPVALSIAATLFSANAFIGGPGWSYNAGMYPFMVNITVPLAVFFSMCVTAPVIYRLRITSIYQYMQLRLGSYSRNLAVIQYVVNSFIQASSMIFIPVLIIKMITGWPFYIIAPLVVVSANIIALVGGVRAVISTDTLQMVIISSGVIIIVISSFLGTQMSISDFIEYAKLTGKLNSLSFDIDIQAPNTFWATLFGATFMWIRYFCFDQSQVQKVLTSKSVINVKRSLTIGAILMNSIYFFMLFIGVILFVFYKGREFDNTNEIILTFITERLPVGFIGLILASIIVEAIVSATSYINSLTTVITKDIYEFYFTNGKKTSLKVTRIITLFTGLIMSIFVIIGFGSTTKSLLDIVGGYISYFSGPACGAFLLAMFTKRANDRGVAAGFIVGLVGGMIIILILKPSWLWNPLIGASITFFIGYIASLLIDGELSKNVEYTVFAIRKNIKKIHGKEILPFTIGKYEAIVLSFFILQYLFLALIQF